MKYEECSEEARQLFTIFSARKGIRHEMDKWDCEDIESLVTEAQQFLDAAMAEARKAAFEECAKIAETLPVDGEPCGRNDIGHGPGLKAYADFIANAPADITTLLAEVERLQGEVTQLCYEPCGNCEALETTNTALRAEVKELEDNEDTLADVQCALMTDRDALAAKLVTAVGLLIDHQNCAGPLGRKQRRRVAMFLASLTAREDANGKA